MRNELYAWKYEKIAEQLRKRLQARGFAAEIIDRREELLRRIGEVIPEGATVTVGGSLTLAETGVLELLRSGRYNFLDRAAAKTPEERRQVELGAFTADFYLCSANAITEDGKLVFLDANGNRVAAVLYGPKRVILVTSVNKLVADVTEARSRLRFISPMNSKRLNLSTPCATTGFCSDCSSNSRICNYFVVVEGSFRNPGRIVVLLTTFEEGL